LSDIFELQDEITKNIVSALDIHLLVGEQGRFWSSSTNNVEAWEYFRQARNLLDAYRSEDVPEVKRLINKALELDPGYATAWSILAGVHFHVEEDARNSVEIRKEALMLTLACSEQALKCDPDCAATYADLGLYYLALKDYEKAFLNVNKAVELTPDFASTLRISAVILNKCGHPEIALEQIRKAMRLCPVYPMWYLTNLGQVTRILGHT
jgi:adenylate cyclase